MKDLAIAVSGLVKTYTSAFGKKEIHALRGVDLNVERGEVFGLLGPNGAGKTTLVKILLGIVRATSGQGHLLGRPIHEPKARMRVGYLPEGHRFPEFLTAVQMLDLYGQMAGVPGPKRKARIPYLLERVGMAEWGDTKIKKFSKGMMQRVGLAQALLNEPDVVFLDEPTDGVDPIGRREIRDILVWMRDEGKTIFLNSHLLSEIEQVCTRVAILTKGEVVREGTIAELTTASLTYTITCSPLSASILQRLGALVEVVDGARQDLHRYRVQTDDRHQLNAVIDQLRNEHVAIEAIAPQRQSLEEYFIDVVSDRVEQ